MYLSTYRHPAIVHSFTTLNLHVLFPNYPNAPLPVAPPPPPTPRYSSRYCRVGARDMASYSSCHEPVFNIFKAQQLYFKTNILINTRSYYLKNHKKKTNILNIFIFVL